MISVEVLQDRNSNYLGLKVTGHALKFFNIRGVNTLCAAVSVLAQTLLVYLIEQKKELSVQKVTSGYLEFKLKEAHPELNSNFELILNGIRIFKDKYPKDIEFIKRIE